MKRILGLILASGALLGMSALAKPNILLIVSEDNGPELGCYGDPYARTPNLDRLAWDRFERAFVPFSLSLQPVARGFPDRALPASKRPDRSGDAQIRALRSRDAERVHPAQESRVPNRTDWQTPRQSGESVPGRLSADVSGGGGSGDSAGLAWSPAPAAAGRP